MFLAFTYASYEDLGWDDTMVLRWNGDTPQYDITVHPFPAPRAGDGSVMEPRPRIFRTKKLLSNSKHLRGRGTRVWVVNELVDGRAAEETFVLKDTWADSSRTREGHITAEIVESVTDGEDRKLVETAFLTTECHGDVHLDGKPDVTLYDEFRDESSIKYLPRYDFNPRTPNEETHNHSTANSQATYVRKYSNSILTKPANSALCLHSKTHYRILFEELCQPLHKTTSLQDILWMLVQATAGTSTILGLVVR